MPPIPTLGTRPNALFYLQPMGNVARSLFKDKSNDKYLALNKNGEYFLEIGHAMSSQAPTTLATLGSSSKSDICLRHKYISRTQCSFEVDPETGVVMLNDCSSRGTSRVIGDKSCGSLKGAPRRLILLPGVNTQIKLGHHGEVELCVIWWIDSTEEALEFAKSLVLKSRLRAQEAQDIPKIAAAKPSGPSPEPVRFHWSVIEQLEAGEFGVVNKGVNHNTGQMMAVKQLKKHDCPENTDWESVMEEVEFLSQIKHPHIVEFTNSCGWDAGVVNLFMDLKHGGLDSLIKSRDLDVPLPNLLDMALRQILEALDYLDYYGIVHRNLKPSNIFYTREEGKYKFYLGDFGLFDYEDIYKTQSDSIIYTAPEIFEPDGWESHKVDIWALYVVMLDLYNVQDFYSRSRKCDRDAVVDLVRAIANRKDTPVARLYDMAARDPDYRYSAREALHEYFGVRCNHSPQREDGTGERRGELLTLDCERSNRSLTPPHEEYMVSQVGGLAVGGPAAGWEGG